MPGVVSPCRGVSWPGLYLPASDWGVMKAVLGFRSVSNSSWRCQHSLTCLTFVAKLPPPAWAVLCVHCDFVQVCSPVLRFSSPEFMWNITWSWEQIKRMNRIETENLIFLERPSHCDQVQWRNIKILFKPSNWICAYCLTSSLAPIFTLN